MSKPGWMNSLFNNLFMKCWRGMLGGVRDYLGEMLEVSLEKLSKPKGNNEENYRGKNKGK